MKMFIMVEYAILYSDEEILLAIESDLSIQHLIWFLLQRIIERKILRKLRSSYVCKFSKMVSVDFIL